MTEQGNATAVKEILESLEKTLPLTEAGREWGSGAALLARP